MKYQQITSAERYIISALRMQGLSVPQIATHLGRHRGTINRELNRNSCHHIDGGYRPSKAQRRTIARRRRSRRNRHYTEADFSIVRDLLRLKWSPEQITGFLTRLGLPAFSHETIYQYIWRDNAQGGTLWTYLRQSPKQRRKRYRAYDSRGRLAGKRHISERPASVESRRYKGHWEIDTVMGKGSLDCIVTLVERKTGYLMIGKLKDRHDALTIQLKAIEQAEYKWKANNLLASQRKAELNRISDVVDRFESNYDTLYTRLHEMKVAEELKAEHFHPVENVKTDETPVWPDPAGEVRGESFLPLHKAVPVAVKQDSSLYELLALVDAIRGGRVREKEAARKEIRKRLEAYEQAQKS